MDSFSDTSSSPARSSVLSIGPSPKKAIVRINSFIDRRWTPDPEIPALASSLWVFDFDTEERRCESDADEEPGGRRSFECRFSYQRFSSESNYRFPTPPYGEDPDAEQSGFETPVVETAKLQFHQGMLVPKLVEYSRSNASSNLSESQNVTPSTPRHRRLDEQTPASSIPSVSSRGGYIHKELVPSPLRPAAAHMRQSSLPAMPSMSAVDHNTPSPPETPQKPIKSKWQFTPRRRDSHCDHGQPNLQRPRRYLFWPRQYSPPKALRIPPPSSARLSSNQGTHCLAMRDVFQEDNVFDEPDNAMSHRETTNKCPPLSPLQRNPVQRPLAAKSNSAGTTIATVELGCESQSSPTARASTARASTLISSSPATTLIDNRDNLWDSKSDKPQAFPESIVSFSPKSRLRRWCGRLLGRKSRQRYSAMW